MVTGWGVALAMVGLACASEQSLPTDADELPTAPASAMGADAGTLAVAGRSEDATLPSGRAIYRPECFGGSRDEGVLMGAGGVGGGGTMGIGGGGMGGAGLGGIGTRGSGSGYGAGPASAPQKSAASAPSPMAPSAPPPAAAAEATARAQSVQLAQDAAAPMAEEEKFAEADQLATGATRGDRPMQPALDWGATVWLSNDDSMSLASAQRVLFAAQEGSRVSPREVRPHELLNYFSFDTRAPAQGDTFGVLASARQDGDQLSVAVSVQGAKPARRPLDLTLVVDRSGSMQEEGRMDYTQRGLHQLSGSLQRGDRVDLVLFDHEVCTPLEDFVVGRDDPALLRRVVDQMRPRGSTDLDLGLKEGYAVARRHGAQDGRNRRMMVITDAQLNTGDVDPNTVSEIGKAYEAEGIRLTGVGVGRGFRDDVLDRLTEKGKGAYVYLGSEAVVDRLFSPAGFASMTQTIAHDVRFAIDLPDSLGMERFYGEESSTQKEDIQPIHYYAGTTQLFLQDLRIRDGRTVRGDQVTFVAEWRDAETGRDERKVWTTSVGALLDSDPRNVDKGRALMAWTDLLLADGMGGDACGAPLATYGERSAALRDDTEIAYVNGLVQKRCRGFEPRVTVAPPRLAAVPYKVKVDSDVVIAEVALACRGQQLRERLSGSDSVAQFQATPGSCTLTLSGPVELAVAVDVPKTGGDARCLVRGGRVTCG
jgi:Ca-activated chloride channel family protein